MTDPERAVEAPELTVLSAMAHGSHPKWETVADALVRALGRVDSDHAKLYNDIVMAALPVAARRTLEAIMLAGTYEYQSDFARRYMSQGEATALLTFLDARGIDVSDEARARITGCTDPEQVMVWVRRAVTAESIDDLFA